MLDELKIQPKIFRGLNQGVDPNLMSWEYSPDCQNIDVSNGTISTRKGISKYIDVPVSIEDATYGVGYAHKLMWLESLQGDQITDLDVNGVPVIGVYFAGDEISGSAYQWYAYHNSAKDADDAAWVLITGTDGVTAAMTDINPDYAHYIEYKIADVPCLIVAGGGTPQKLYVSYGEGPGYTYSVFAEDLDASAPDDAVYVALHRERVWMAGNLNGVDGQYVEGVNTIYTSNAYDPADWTTAGETAETVAETFDGDYIRGIINALDDIFIFKKNRVFHVVGDTPDEYEMREVYSVSGTQFGDSICTDGSYCFFAGEDGIYQYDANVGMPLLVKEIQTLYRSMVNPKGLVTGNKLYMWDRQTIAGLAGYTGKCIVYDLITKTINVMYSRDMYDAIVSNGKVLFTDGNYIYEL